MPLNRPALTLGRGSSGAQEARHWVVETCQAIDRPELIECAEIGVAELVANALLHGKAPIQVRVRGTRAHPRVEVRDRSRHLPVPPRPRTVDEEVLTFGRGLSIVSRCALAWGADLEVDGKVVWFLPAADIQEVGAVGVFTGQDSAAPRAAGNLVLVELRGVPTKAFAAFERHYRELRREVRLLALAPGTHYPQIRELAEAFTTVDRQLQDLDADLLATSGSRTLRLMVARDVGPEIDRFVHLLDLADEFCREERLLSLARSPAERSFQEWLLGELGRQSRGDPPLTWASVRPAAGPHPAS